MRLLGKYMFSCFFILTLVTMATARAYLTTDIEAAIENMRQIPQWHCLRYRKFNLVRRCRNYRLGRKQH